MRGSPKPLSDLCTVRAAMAIAPSIGLRTVGYCRAVWMTVLFHRNLDKTGEENVAVPLSW